MKPIFIAGCPRSGTTLLGALLGAHSDCICVPEMPFKFDLLDLSWDGGRVPAERVQAILHRSWKFRLWGIAAPTAATLHGTLDSRDVVERLVREYTAALSREDASAWVDHTPENIRNFRKLSEAFPDARFVHIVRDGRGVASSLLRVRWGPGTPSGAARYWAAEVAFGLAAERAYGDAVVPVRFEKLVSDPRSVMTYLADRLGLRPEECLGRVTRYAVPKATQKQHALVEHSPDPGRSRAWEDELTRREIEIVEAHVGDLLSSLGYEPVTEFSGRRLGPRDRVALDIGDGLAKARQWWLEIRTKIVHKLRITDPTAPGSDRGDGH